ncbi:ATP-binding protein [Halomonas kalidii]|uniref:histidine kinase n=1 Tax=Halomonas kalidii TaxID=3043293 RepID=A0ABT6VEM1_9GAMM|nr:ATP-binding protein [Halomonas kalidii]MDI5932437.1 ATP-binding protein [Halomonas kalidii]
MSRWRRLPVLCLVGVALASLWWLWQWQYAQSEVEARRHADNRLSLYGSSLQGALERFSYLPGLLAHQPQIQAALLDPAEIFVPQVNAFLALVAERSGAEVIFLLDAEGRTLASSNHAEADSFVGHDYRFRPYFYEAMATGQGEFFAVGSTTGRPGYFVSAAVGPGAPEAAQGVLVAKVSLEALQADWRRAGEKVLLTDANGVVILSSRPEWRYRRLGELTPQAREEIRRQRQFMGEPLEPLGRRLRDDSLLVGGAGPGERLVDTTLALETLGWTMHYLMPVRPLYVSARNALMGGVAVWVALLLLALWLRERQKRQRLREREAMIIREANERLEARVVERTRELQEAQAELVQAGKLAALGTMAAGIAHELNQPLSGIRTYAANGQRLLDRGRSEAADDNFQRIQALCERLGGLIRQLKLFARKGGAREPVDLVARLDFVLELLAERCRQQGVRPRRRLPGGELWVLGDEVRVEQLLTNLLRNALDALRGAAEPWLEIAIEAEAGRLVVTVADNGTGIPDELLEQLFDPFFTTKAVGDGLGLGLFISYGIVQDLGGRIHAGNRPSGGAWFRVELPRAQPTAPASPSSIRESQDEP